MLFLWMSRCIPGFSIIALLSLLAFAFPDSISLPLWKGLYPSTGTNEPSNSSNPLSLAQKIFLTYSVLIHLSMFGFTVRLSFALFRVTKETKEALERRAWRTPRSSFDGRFVDSPIANQEYPDPSAFKTNDSREEEEVIHAIIVPNYAEDIDTLRTTLNVLASHPRASSQYEIYLAMEQKEPEAAEKAAKLVSVFEKSFLQIRPTFHPAGLPGEIAGKSSNVAFSARHIIEIYRADLTGGSCKVIITVMDGKLSPVCKAILTSIADTHLSQDYFTEIRRLHYTHPTEADRSIYCCPIIFDRNSHRTPILVRCADLLWAFAGLSTMYPGAPISIPTSVYSLPLLLAEKVGGWDSDPTAIGEDMHMMLKCYFETAGNVVSRVVYIPASQCNVSSETGTGWRRTLDTCMARYRQALRHMWGALDSGFAIRRSVSYLRFHSRCLFFRPRHFVLLHLLWEAHFLPSHLLILMLFSGLYEFCTPVAELHPIMKTALWLTSLLRASSFVGMNICLALYERWHDVCLNARMRDMSAAKLTGTGFSPRTWWHPKYLLERLFFPIAGTVYGPIPAMHAVFSHFWTDRLVYRVSKKPAFVSESGMV